MAGVAGRSGTNKGKDKPYRDALRRAIARAEQSESPHALDRIAEKHLAKCIEGDVGAMKELADRLDGKVPQGIGGDDELPAVRLEKIERIIVDPKSANPDG